MIHDDIQDLLEETLKQHRQRRLESPAAKAVETRLETLKQLCASAQMHETKVVNLVQALTPKDKKPLDVAVVTAAATSLDKNLTVLKGNLNFLVSVLIAECADF